MKVERVIDAIDEQCEREAMAISRFRREIGSSINQVGTPKGKARVRVNQNSTNQHHYQGARSGVWRGL